jgi:hypothetical protein
MSNTSNTNQCVFDPCTLFLNLEDCKTHSYLSCIYLSECQTTHDCSSYNRDYLSLCDDVPQCAVYGGIYCFYFTFFFFGFILFL